MWIWLVVAIACEVAATLSLRASEGFTRLLPSVVVVVGYAFAFYALSQALVRGMQLGQAYAVWSGLGISLIALLGIVVFGEQMTPVQLFGLVLVIAGIACLELGASHG
ncbi:multidrug efflux SMR transporter [Nocardioides sp. AE5]|uniref:DMT family transporter n=1 Tax=Nocardioides sp. AE5 TaxID=2962573 RepID=UPI002881F0D7|nr:multidrug efflux SMR transporter [Nocardioides sp. AE5]MDT0201868.1 multidrug efflux SMR transporter [Nocardioides sp. AE5]